MVRFLGWIGILLMLSLRMRMAAAGINVPPPPAANWWEAGTASGAIGVYDALAAANKTASLVDLSGNGNDLTETGTTTWAAGSGWTFGGTQFFDTGINAIEGYTILVSYVNSGSDKFAMGAYTNPRALAIVPMSTTSGGSVQYWSGSAVSRTPALEFGVLGVAADQPYRNGVADGSAISAWGGSVSPTITIGKLNGFATNFFTGVIRRVAIYDNELSAADIKLVSRKMHDFPMFFGDSVTSGTGASDAAHRWVNLVAAAQGWGAFANAGISGTVLQNTTQNSVTTIGGAAANNGRDTYITRLRNNLPQYVIILYGLNDLRLDDVAFTAANYENDLGEIVDGLVADGMSADNIVIGSPPYIDPTYYAHAPYAPFDGGSTSLHEDYVAAAAAVATAKGTRYADVYQAMLDNGDDSLIYTDGVHPNDAGHDVIADAIIAALA